MLTSLRFRTNGFSFCVNAMQDNAYKMVQKESKTGSRVDLQNKKNKLYNVHVECCKNVFFLFEKKNFKYYYKKKRIRIRTSVYAYKT